MNKIKEAERNLLEIYNVTLVSGCATSMTPTHNCDVSVTDIKYKNHEYIVYMYILYVIVRINTNMLVYIFCICVIVDSLLVFH